MIGFARHRAHHVGASWRQPARGRRRRRRRAARRRACAPWSCARTPACTGSCPRCGPRRSRPWCRTAGCSRRGRRGPCRASRTRSPEAPAPENTTRTSSIFLPWTRSALSSAAPEMIAVPCWSSWKTGMSSVSISRRSISKHSGARMSSRLMPPKVGREQLAGADDLVGVGAGDLDVEDVDVGEALEQDALAFHHRLAGEGAEVAEPEHRGAVRDHGDEVALGRVAVDVLGIPGDLEARLGDAGAVGEREVGRGGGWLGWDDLDLPGAPLGVVAEGGFLVGHGRSLFRGQGDEEGGQSTP